jgi:hypothetical protein
MLGRTQGADQKSKQQHLALVTTKILEPPISWLCSCSDVGGWGDVSGKSPAATANLQNCQQRTSQPSEIIKQHASLTEMYALLSL